MTAICTYLRYFLLALFIALPLPLTAEHPLTESETAEPDTAAPAMADQPATERCVSSDSHNYNRSQSYAQSRAQSQTLSQTQSKNYDKLVLIIDDLGHNLARGREALALPGKITYAVIPFTPHGTKLANTAEAAGKEIIVHAPMSTQDATPLGAGGLTPELNREEFRATLVSALDYFPQAQGINNHMGSDLTERRRQMAWIMQELRWRDLYFVDSRTSDKTVAATVATEFRVPNLSRHVFLDNDPVSAAIDERFQVLVAKARQEGFAVGIGHPYPATLEYLRAALPKLEAQGIRLAFVSEALAWKETDHATVVQRQQGPEQGCQYEESVANGSETDANSTASASGTDAGAVSARVTRAASGAKAEAEAASTD